MSESTSPAANRRNSHRRAPKDGIRIACHPDADGRGPDLAVCLLDASQTGLRLLVREALPEGQQVLLVLHGTEGGAAVKRQAVVMWSVPMADGSCGIGVQFSRRLTFKDLLGLTQLM